MPRILRQVINYSGVTALNLKFNSLFIKKIILHFDVILEIATPIILLQRVNVSPTLNSRDASFKITVRILS
jgi:hypothetical protein